MGAIQAWHEFLLHYNEVAKTLEIGQISQLEFVSMLETYLVRMVFENFDVPLCRTKSIHFRQKGT